MKCISDIELIQSSCDAVVRQVNFDKFDLVKVKDLLQMSYHNTTVIVRKLQNDMYKKYLGKLGI